MPKQPKMQNEICNYILNVLYEQHKKQTANKITRIGSNLKKYPTKESLVDLVLSDQKFIDSQLYEEKQPGQATISKGTIRKAINKLISENKIALIEGSYTYVPHMDQSLAKHPILDIASQVNVTIGVPEDMLVLSVQEGYAPSISSFLSSLFYKGDIVFIPIGNTILCISVFPNEIIASNSKSSDKPQKSGISLHHRIASALYQFKCSYPNFVYGLPYEVAYLLSHNEDIIKMMQPSKTSSNIYPDSHDETFFRRLQENIVSIVEYANNESDSLDLVSEPTEEDLELWDLINDEISE